MYTDIKSIIKVEQALNVFENKIFNGNSDEIVVCKLNDALVKDNGHKNAIPSNLIMSNDHILFYLATTKDQNFNIYNYRIHLFNMYLTVENIIALMKHLEIETDVQFKEYGNLMRVKRWANFFKHPKSFLLVHNSVYSFDRDLITNEIAPIIDDDFVYTYYRREGNEKVRESLKEQLMNKSGLSVLLPDPVSITEGFCNDLIKFVNSILNDEDYMRKIYDESTINV